MLIGHCLLRERVRPRDIVAFAIGQGLVLAYHYLLLPQPPVSRLTFALDILPSLTRAFWTQPIMHLMLSLNCFWLAVFFQKNISFRQILVLCMCFALAFLATDYTRVFLLVGFPLVLQVTENICDESSTVDRSALAYMPYLGLLQAQFTTVAGGFGIIDTNWPYWIAKLVSHFS
jgi:hypothetical protein